MVAPFLWAYLVLGVALTVGCTPGTQGSTSPDVSPVNIGAGSGLSRYKERKLAEISPYAQSHRWETYLVINDLFDRIWQQPRSKKTLKKADFQTFDGFPRLHLEDRDNDGRAEFYVYLPPDGSQNSQEFGAFF